MIKYIKLKKKIIRLKRENIRLTKENKKMQLEKNAIYGEALIKNDKHYLVPAKIFEELWGEHKNKPIQYIKENELGLIYKDKCYIQDITVNYTPIDEDREWTIDETII